MMSIRKTNLAKANRLGYPINPSLPLLDPVEKCRELSEITDRLFCLYAVVACSYGFSKERALSWLKREGVVDSLSGAENQYLHNKSDTGIDSRMQWKVEALWALAWCLECHPDLDFADSCSDSFIGLLPDIAKDASTKEFRQGLNLRDQAEILSKTDLAYCLHWAIREAELKGVKPPGRVPANVVVERRHALEWVIGQDSWDDVSLDT